MKRLRYRHEVYKPLLTSGKTCDIRKELNNGDRVNEHLSSRQTSNPSSRSPISLSKEWLTALLPGTVLFGLSFGLRLAFNLSWVPLKISDEASLYSYALNVMGGQYYGTDGAYWPPGLIILAGLLFRLFGPDADFWYLRLLQSFLGAGSTVLIFTLGRRLFGTMAGVLAGILAALYVPFVFYTGRFLTETLYIFLILLGTYLFTLFVAAHQAHKPNSHILPPVRIGKSPHHYNREYRGINHQSDGNDAERCPFPSLFLLLASGFTFGLASLTRPVALFLPVLLGGWLVIAGRTGWKTAIKSTAVISMTMTLTILPWTYRNYRVMGVPVLIDVNGGINFYLGHNPKADGTWVDMGPADPVLNGPQGPDKHDLDRLGFAAGLDFIRKYPQQELNLIERKHFLFWNSRDWDVYLYAKQLKRLYELLHLPWLEFTSIKYLTYGGMVLGILAWEQASLPLLFIVYNNLVVIAFYFIPRYRMVAEPFMLILAGFFLSSLYYLVTTGRLHPQNGNK